MPDRLPPLSLRLNITCEPLTSPDPFAVRCRKPRVWGATSRCIFLGSLNKGHMRSWTPNSVSEKTCSLPACSWIRQNSRSPIPGIPQQERGIPRVSEGGRAWTSPTGERKKASRRECFSLFSFPDGLLKKPSPSHAHQAEQARAEQERGSRFGDGSDLMHYDHKIIVVLVPYR